MKNDKKQYSAPELTVVSFHVERGFTLSDEAASTFHMFFLDETPTTGYNAQSQQNWAAEQTPGGNIFGDTW